FFFQAEDGIRDFHVTGVQTCALPIWRGADLFDRTGGRPPPANVSCSHLFERTGADDPLARRSANSPAIACFLPLAPMVPRRSEQIGRASCREWVAMAEIAACREDRVR